MSRWICCSLALMLSTLGLAQQQPASRDQPTILCLGDSITQGGKGFPCYRWFLAPALREQGIAVEFVGPRRDSWSAHAGYGGKNTAWLRKQFDEIYRSHPADFILIHSGHNSFNKDKPVAGIIRDTEAIIRQAHAIKPGVSVLLGQVIPSGKLPKYAYIPELNKALCELAVRLRKERFAVTVVDVGRGFDWKTDALADKVHPNEAGARKMANAWLKALLPLLQAR